MIWWLIRRDPAWRFTGPVVIMFATLVGLWHFFAPHGTAAESVLLGGAFAIPLSAAIVATVVHQSDIGFQAILPVRVRQVFAAQMIAVSAVMWLPVLAGCIILFLLHDVNVLAMPLGTWSVATCAALVFHCTMMRGTTKPGWPAIALLFIAPLSKPFAMPFLAAVVCWMLCAAFIMRTWRVVPASFQFAPVAAVSASRPLPARRSRSGGRSWKTLLVTLSPASGLGYAFAFVVTALWYSPLLVFFLVIFGQNWSDVRSRVRWLLDLPLSPRSLMAAFTLPGIVSLVGGYLLGIQLTFLSRLPHHVDLRRQIITVALIAALSMTWNLGSMAVGWRPSRWPGILMLVAVFGWQIYVILQTPADPYHWMSSVFPTSLTGTIAMAILLTGTLFIAMDRLFRRLELL